MQEADQTGEGQRGHEGGAGQVQVALRRHQRLPHRGGGEEMMGLLKILHNLLQRHLSQFALLKMKA